MTALAGLKLTNARVKGKDGIRRTVEVAKRVKPWWFIADNGK